MATTTLVNSWTPTLSGCLRTSDYWIWDYEVDMDQRTVLGGPSQIQNCLPSSWGGTVTYSGTGCPPEYTSACQGTDSASAVTCCPRAYGFTCQPTTTGGLHRESFRCMSQQTGTDTIHVTRTALQTNTIAFETRVEATSLHLFALAIIYTTPASTATDGSSIATGSTTGTSSTPETSSGNNSAALSPGQAAGIGVGAGVGVLLLGSIVAFILWRRSALLKRAENTPNVAQYTNYPPPPKPRELPTNSEPSELDAFSVR
ncbi:uncharacterized protein F4807DRAFT_444058 [Annulohypoxylon truncatum]|uniref:uncharacterized protein n=1 Tax=Annulohypoxylon truncatum TaxID=327061 RepID=UPI00200751A1|nr:uncharacterized protein F4807DRAFT_444058 [Annulohypoxylon truncatum]KAI1205263.1 hypothetical protein F4807DRAFT_444058 [Annulohypoxylon truncatum]